LSKEQCLPYTAVTLVEEKKKSRDSLIKQGLIFDNGNCLYISAPVVQVVLIRRLHGYDQPVSGVTTTTIESIRDYQATHLQIPLA